MSNEFGSAHGVEASMKCADLLEPQSRQQFLRLRRFRVVAAVDDELSIAREVQRSTHFQHLQWDVADGRVSRRLFVPLAWRSYVDPLEPRRCGTGQDVDPGWVELVHGRQFPSSRQVVSSRAQLAKP